MWKLPSFLARTLTSGTSGLPLLPDMAEGLDSRFFRAFYVSKAEMEDEHSLNQDRESAVYSPSVPAQSARYWKIEVLCSRSSDSVSANTVLINACYGIFTGGVLLCCLLPAEIDKHKSQTVFPQVRSRLRDIVGASTNWRDHVQAMQERKALHTLLAKRQEDLPPRRMKDSYLEVILPLGSQPQIREKYLNVYNSVRFGRILEDLDSLGVLICYTHTKQETQPRSPLSIVTALVDKINLHKKVVHPDCDIKFTGNVSWVGKTSMEVKMHMLQLHDGDYCPVLDATFVMVARDPENKRPAFVNPLIPESPEEEEIFKQGEMNKLKRIDFSTASLLKMAPTAEERNIVHDIFLNTLDTRTVSFRSRVLPPNSVWMEDAKLKGLQICHPQERNIFNRIFGGFLMRKAFELGWATACSCGGSRPFIVSVDDIMFQRPVEVGSLLLLSGQVCYTEKNYIQVRVHSEVYDADTREHHTTNIFHFTFISENEVPRVVPKTYGESMLYLDGKRHFAATMKEI